MSNTLKRKDAERLLKEIKDMEKKDLRNLVKTHNIDLGFEGDELKTIDVEVLRKAIRDELTFIVGIEKDEITKRPDPIMTKKALAEKQAKEAAKKPTVKDDEDEEEKPVAKLAKKARPAPVEEDAEETVEEKPIAKKVKKIDADDEMTKTEDEKEVKETVKKERKPRVVSKEYTEQTRPENKLADGKCIELVSTVEGSFDCYPSVQTRELKVVKSDIENPIIINGKEVKAWLDVDGIITFVIDKQWYAINQKYIRYGENAVNYKCKALKK